MSKSRGFAFTVNNYDKDERHYQTVELLDSADYGIMGYEQGEEGTRHLQCYVHYKTPQRFSKVKRAIPFAHIEEAFSSPKRNILYCRKQGVYVEFGQIPNISVPLMDSLIQKIKAGTTYKEILDEYPTYALHHKKVIEEVIEMYKPKPQSVQIIHCKEEHVLNHIDEGESVCEDYDIYDGEDVIVMQVYSKHDTPSWFPRFGGRWKKRSGYRIIEVVAKKIVLYYR